MELDFLWDSFQLGGGGGGGSRGRRRRGLIEFDYNLEENDCGL